MEKNQKKVFFFCNSSKKWYIELSDNKIRIVNGTINYKR